VKNVVGKSGVPGVNNRGYVHGGMWLQREVVGGNSLSEENRMSININGSRRPRSQWGENACGFGIDLEQKKG
jgi:hypothetical protein